LESAFINRRELLRSGLGAVAGGLVLGCRTRGLARSELVPVRVCRFWTMKTTLLLLMTGKAQPDPPQSTVMIMRYALLVALLFLCLANLNCASSRLPGWTLLGERTVNHSVDRDEIRVGARDGTFRRIKLLVLRRRVTFRDVKVHYANGGVEDINLRRQVPAGGQTRAIDLNGSNRVIEKVVFFYDTTSNRGRRAVVQLYAQ
ncbi:MAG: hypothetical protein V3S24_08750, partial [Candidatus Tectomicrobia bacterium]